MKRREFWLGEWSLGQWFEGLLATTCLIVILTLYALYVWPGPGVGTS